MDTIALIQAAAPSLKSVAEGVTASQLDDPTPCSDLNVKQLSNHIAGFWGMTAMAARKQPLEGGDPNMDFVGDNPGAVIPGMVDGGVAAWQVDGSTDGKTQFGPGEYDAAFAAQVTLFEEVLHGWDLAAATGQTIDVPSDVGDAVFEIAQILCTPEQRGEGKPFSTEVSVVANASSFERALGLTGRDPGWSV